MDKMRLFSQTQDNVLRRQRANITGVEDRAICDSSGKGSPILGSKTQSVTDVGAQTVRPDQEIGFVAGLGPAARQSDRDEIPVNLKLDDLCAKRQFDVRSLLNRFDERSRAFGGELGGLRLRRRPSCEAGAPLLRQV